MSKNASAVVAILIEMIKPAVKVETARRLIEGEKLPVEPEWIAEQMKLTLKRSREIVRLQS